MIRTLGVLGGISWESTAIYYRLLNRGVAGRLGGLHSAPLILHSLEFSEIADLQKAGKWDEAGKILAHAAVGLELAGAEALVMTSNTMHYVADAIQEAVRIPLLHIVDPVGEVLEAAGIRRAGLLGTRYTMELPFWRERMMKRFAIDVIVPESEDRDLVHRVIFDELCLGVVSDASRKHFVEVIERLAAAGAEAVILGCTEIGMLIGGRDVLLPVFDTTELHAAAAVKFASHRLNNLTPRERWTAVVIAVAVTIWIALGRALDFRVYWEAGRSLLDAGWGAVYDPAGLTPFKYHPVFAVAFAPWGMLPWIAARLAWALFNGVLLLDMQRRWVLHWRFDAAALFMGFIGVVHALSWQVQVANVTFVMLWCFTVALTTPRPWIRAVMYGLLLALKPYWLVLLLPWTLGRRWSTAVGAALGLVLISLIPVLVGVTGAVQAYRLWFATLTGPAEAHNYPKLDNQGWYGLLSRHGDAIGSGLPWIWLAGCALVALLWLVPWVRQGWSRPGPVEQARLELSVVPVFLWAAPLSWMHHQILLWPLLAWLWMEGRTDRATRGVWIVSWLLLNGTGRAVAGRAFSRTLLRLGLPILAYPLLGWWGTRCARVRGPEASSLQRRETQVPA